ncbi:MAG: hypothetical protein AAGF07_05375 [Patescibacteria group bacterium]
MISKVLAITAIASLLGLPSLALNAQSLTNEARIESPTFDPDLSNNSTISTVQYSQTEVDLEITKSVTVEQSGDLTLEINYKNNSNIEVPDPEIRIEVVGSTEEFRVMSTGSLTPISSQTIIEDNKSILVLKLPTLPANFEDIFFLSLNNRSGVSQLTFTSTISYSGLETRTTNNTDESIVVIPNQTPENEAKSETDISTIRTGGDSKKYNLNRSLGIILVTSAILVLISYYFKQKKI